MRLFKLAVAAFGSLCSGMYLTLMIEDKVDFTFVVGMILSVLLALCAGIGAYKEED